MAWKRSNLSPSGIQVQKTFPLKWTHSCFLLCWILFCFVFILFVCLRFSVCWFVWVFLYLEGWWLCKAEVMRALFFEVGEFKYNIIFYWRIHTPAFPFLEEESHYKLGMEPPLLNKRKKQLWKTPSSRKKVKQRKEPQ